MLKKYKPLNQINRLYYILIIYIFIYTAFCNKIIASGAYDKGSATGKGRFELSLTINPFGIIPYGQNYAVLSYGLNNKTDLVSYYSSHQNGTKSKYLGLLYQFFNSERLDLATAIGIRYKSNNKTDFFIPQLLYNYDITEKISIGGSIVNVIENKNYNFKGNAIDITVYKKLNILKNLNNQIKNAYFGIGVFKNTDIDLNKDNLYLHYSIDIVF